MQEGEFIFYIKNLKTIIMGDQIYISNMIRVRALATQVQISSHPIVQTI